MKDLTKLEIYQYGPSGNSKIFPNNICLVNCSKKTITFKNGEQIGFAIIVQRENKNGHKDTNTLTESYLSNIDKNYPKENGNLPPSSISKSKNDNSKTESSFNSHNESIDSSTRDYFHAQGKMLPPPLSSKNCKKNYTSLNDKINSEVSQLKKNSNLLTLETVQINQQNNKLDKTWRNLENIKDGYESDNSILNYDFDENYLEKFKQNTLLGKKQELKTDLEVLTKRYSKKTNSACIRIKNIQKNCYNNKGGKKKKITVQNIEFDIKELLLLKIEEGRFMKESLTRLWKKIENI